jgi:hypothetical protein
MFTGDPDYKMKCIGFWKENLKSYLITYDELDAFSKYRCWVSFSSLKSPLPLKKHKNNNIIFNLSSLSQ